MRETIGIMQGRLSPPVDGKIQAFPAAHWREEFPVAKKAGLDCIEWIYDGGPNPLETEEGIAEIQQLSRETEIRVSSICADYFMARRLIASSGEAASPNVERLKWLVGRAARLGAGHIVLPFVDSSSLRTLQQRAALIAVLSEVLPTDERAGIELHLETDWFPRELAELFERVPHELVRANYDIGNSASLGYDPSEELPVIAQRLGSVHVKDRVRGGGTVPLGSGDADFPTCFRLIREAGFRGPFILQPARDETLDEVDLAVRNRRFVDEVDLAVRNRRFVEEHLTAAKPEQQVEAWI